MVSEIQRERVLPETILPGLCDFSYSIPHIAEPSAVDAHIGVRPYEVRRFIRCAQSKNSGSVAAIFMSCNLGILQYFTIFYIKNYFMSFF